MQYLIFSKKWDLKVWFRNKKNVKAERVWRENLYGQSVCIGFKLQKVIHRSIQWARMLNFELDRIDRSKTEDI